MTVGERLKHYRALKGFTQERLAALADVTFKTVNRIERGHTSPSILTLEKLAVPLEISVIDFLRAEPNAGDKTQIGYSRHPASDLAFSVSKSA